MLALADFDYLFLWVPVALSGFASGALVAAPLAAVLTWLTVSWQQHVDLRVERDTAAVQADRAAFNAGFGREWDAMAGRRSAAACDPEATAELTRLRKRTAELEAKLSGSSDELQADARELRALMTEDKQ